MAFIILTQSIATQCITAKILQNGVIEMFAWVLR